MSLHIIDSSAENEPMKNPTKAPNTNISTLVIVGLVVILPLDNPKLHTCCVEG
jgi:hypothetical protein